MFACIYFLEDASLGVVGRNDKNLNIGNGDFKERQKVSMKWSSTIYNGMIINVHDSEEALTEHAKKLHQIVRAYEKKPVSVPEELFTVPFKTNEKQNAGKRKSKKTEKILESAAQEAQFSPKKKKKTTGNTKKDKEKSETTVSHMIKPNQEKKKLQEVSALKSSIVLSDMIKQFHDGGTDMSADTSPVQVDDQRTKEATLGTQMTKEATLGTQMTKEATLGTQMTKEATLGTQMTKEATATFTTLQSTISSDSNEGSTSLLATWSLCQRSNEENIMDQANHDIQHKIPVPPPEVLTFFKVVGRPDVQDFMKKCAEHFQSSNCTHEGFSCFEDANQDWNVHTASQEWRPDMYPGADREYHFEDYHTPLTGPIDANNTSTPLKSPLTTAGLQLESFTEESFTDISTSFPLRRSPRKLTSLSSKGETNVMKATDQNSKQAPRKKEDKDDDQQNLSLEKKEPLLKTFENVLVSTDKIRSSISAAKKAVKPGYTLCYNLLLGVFSVEEMANSRGQGLLKAKATDMRPVLSAEKISAVKEYTMRWCKKNEKGMPTEAELNHAVTEQVSHCRKKLKKQLQRQ